MITGLTGIQGVTVMGGGASLPYVSPNANNPLTGMLRVNNTNMEVFNGSNWQAVTTTHATVGLDSDTQDLLAWARAQRTMALNRIDLASKNPALMKALEAIKRAEDNFELLQRFVENDNDNVQTG